MAAPLSDRQWLARFGYGLGAGGYLRELDPSKAADWLVSFLTGRGGAAPSAELYAAGAKAGWPPSTLKRARVLADVTATRVPKADGRGCWTEWALPEPATAEAAALPPRAVVAPAAVSSASVGRAGRSVASVGASVASASVARVA